MTKARLFSFINFTLMSYFIFTAFSTIYSGILHPPIFSIIELIKTIIPLCIHFSFLEMAGFAYHTSFKIIPFMQRIWFSI